MSRLYLALLFLFTLIAGLLGYGLLTPKEGQQDTNVEPELIPDYVAKDLQSQFFDAKGKKSHIVSAAQMEHYEILGFTHFKKARYIIYPENGKTPWQVDAAEAVLYPSERIILESRVVITTLGDDFLEKIETEYLEIDLTSKTMASDEIVTILGPNYVTKGKGLRADIDAQKINLINHVDTVYVPQS